MCGTARRIARRRAQHWQQRAVTVCQLRRSKAP
jgi:hypothetical protein